MSGIPIPCPHMVTGDRRVVLALAEVLTHAVARRPYPAGLPHRGQLVHNAVTFLAGNWKDSDLLIGRTEEKGEAWLSHDRDPPSLPERRSPRYIVSPTVCLASTTPAAGEDDRPGLGSCLGGGNCRNLRPWELDDLLGDSCIMHSPQGGGNIRPWEVVSPGKFSGAGWEVVRGPCPAEAVR